MPQSFGIPVAGQFPPLTLDDIARSRPDFAMEAVFLDLDGTCLDARQQLHPETEAAIKQASGRVPVVLATGRMYRSALQWAERLQLETPLICYQGALIRDVPSRGGRTLLSNVLPAAPAKEAIDLARRNGWHRQAFVNDDLFCEEDRPEAHLYAQIANVPINFVDDLLSTVSDGATKIVYISADTGVIAAALKAATHELGDTARVTTSLPQLVEIVSPTAGKGPALRSVCAHLGVEVGATLAIGDAANDRDLLEAAGFGVAIRPINAALLGVADATCAPPQEAGVAIVLRGVGLSE